ncbi:AAA-domain-containing protein [Scleroderma citrinum]
MPSTRRSTRATTHSPTHASGSEYRDSEHMEEDLDHNEPPEPDPFTQTSRGRRIRSTNYFESHSESDHVSGDPADLFGVDNVDHAHGVRANGRAHHHIDQDDDDDQQPRRATRNSRAKRQNDLSSFIVSDEDDSGKRRLRERRKPPPPPPAKTSSGRISKQPQRYMPSAVPTRSLHKPASRNRRRPTAENDDAYADEGSDASSDGDASLDNAPRTSSDVDLDADAEGERDPDADADGEPDLETGTDGRPYSLRQRAKINYAIPPPLEEIKAPPPPKSRGGGGRGGAGGRNRRGPGWSATGAELSRWMGMPADDSDSDVPPLRTPRKNFGDAALLGAGAMSAGGSGLFPGDFAAATGGTPSNLGKIGEGALADADPLGVNQNVTFDEVGGLDDHIHALKEMTLLPLLYPEVFQRFGLTPPRGVLFHGPPGTGKTLLARALAASCRSNGKGISFFMRKGADCLSKWVGEAERQLRLLFEEARHSQPSIIFFDEIDGLAPVRSSKQDQIHASIVSTLLALMDGMDGRGQVVVIGATNRPDAVDPALRRPGRFDREFYFPLPSLDAREKILGIMTKGWEGWGVDGTKAEENTMGLAKLTKGYGGADLRALCTEAALNAIQRRYPQIYASNDRLLINPETIGVTLRDFMISIQKLVPSSARSTATAASPLPSQLVPLLGETFDQVKGALVKALPARQKRTVLEEAQWEEDNEEGALEREMLMQSMESLRVYRPRLLLHGVSGMGQGYVGAAVLHFLEGYHVQSLDLGTLMGDSTRTPEAAVVQLFVEARRHQPSVLYIPALSSWSAALSETVRSTVRAMLDSLGPTDPILLLAVSDAPFSSLPRDVKAWFGITRSTRIVMSPPRPEHISAYFSPLLADIRKPPSAFADGLRRRRRVLETLPLAPPPEPRQPTAAELAVQEESDRKVITVLKYRLGPVVTELKRKFKRFTKRAREEYDFEALMMGDDLPGDSGAPGGDAPAADGADVPDAAGGGATGVVREVEVVASNVTFQAENGVVEMMQETVMQEVHGPAEVNGASHIDGPVDLFSQVLPQSQSQLQAQVQIPVLSQSYPASQSQAQMQPQVQAQVQPQPPAPVRYQPRLYDTDLERMHMDLHKGKYLTPQDFLDDIRRIVHNATVCAHQDGDRLHKAQAMLTAAEMSVLELFDAQFKVDCERMAGRERKRREERKREKEKERAAAEAAAGQDGGANGAYAPGTRRSARHNGQQPEIQITDPLQLERRLKRARSAGDGERPSGSPEAGGAGGEDKADETGMIPRQQKRARTILLSDDEDHDPIDLLVSPSASQAQTQGRLPVSVRFANDVQPVQMSVVLEQHQEHQQGAPTVNGWIDAMMVDCPTPTPRHDALDPFMVPSHVPHQQLAPEKAPTMSISHLLNGDTHASHDHTPILSPLPQAHHDLQPQFFPTAVAATSVVPVVQPQPSPPRTPVPSTSADLPPSSMEPMVISPPREPSRPPTPLPEFHVDEALMSTLQDQLNTRTDQLSVEMLEQLRAMCLGCVWRHRAEWNRDALVREILGVLDEFLDDFADSACDVNSSSPAVAY